MCRFQKLNFSLVPIAVFLCFVTAVVTLFMGILRLGWTHFDSQPSLLFLTLWTRIFPGFVANFISAPVISGFTSGVALTIVATQLKSLLGLKFDKEGFLPTVMGVIEHFPQRNNMDFYMSIIGLSTYVLLKVRIVQHCALEIVLIRVDFLVHSKHCCPLRESEQTCWQSLVALIHIS